MGLTGRGLLGAWAVERFISPLLGEESTSNLRPYLHLLQPDSVWVSWWSNTDAETWVDWGTTAGSLSNTASGSALTMSAQDRYHAVRMTGLQPNQYYFYRVRSERETSATFRFRTPPQIGQKTGRFRVLLLGDNQILTNERRWARLMERAKIKLEDKFGVPIEEAVDMVLNPGDQVDVGTLDHWRNLHFNYSNLVSPNLSFMTTVGNHETYSDSGLARYKSLFMYDQVTYQGITSPDPKVYYAYQYANILFIHLSSEHTGTTQANWVQSIINAAAVDSSVDFIISVCHRPYQAEQFVGDISSWLRTTVMPILCQTPKHMLNIGAHHHLYARGQTRDWPCYHIISGATAWDQFWGQSTETDFDDVQKTIANWAWQLLDFDLANRRMDVECYAEANVKFPESTRWTTQAYNSRLIDQFSRQSGLAVPATPSITTAITGPVTLPLTLASSAFSSASAQVLNSVHFQIAKDAAFTQLRVDRIRDVENLYGDTGSPLWEPINRNAGVNVLEWTLATGSQPNGSYHARVRHRDANASWSAWSTPVAFTIQGSVSGDPKLTLAKKVYNNSPSENIAITFEYAPGNTRDWVAIYQKGQTPGGPASTQWNYLNGSKSAPAAPILNGTVSFPASALTAGNREWFATLLVNDGYTEAALRIPFFVGTTPVLTLPKTEYNVGETVRITYANAPATNTAPRNKDWVAIYRVGETPGDDYSTDWSYLTNASGFRDFANLPKGYYFATYLVNDEWFEIAERVFFSVGTEIATVTCPAIWQAGSPLSVQFSDGPAIAKDYIGIFREGVEFGVGSEGSLIDYLYFGGTSSGTVTFVTQPPPGRYVVGLFTNDSYTNVSNMATFTVRAPPSLELEASEFSGGQMHLTLQTQVGKTYTVKRSTNLSDWSDVLTVSGNGGVQVLSVNPDPESMDRCFFRVFEE